MNYRCYNPNYRSRSFNTFSSTVLVSGVQGKSYISMPINPMIPIPINTVMRRNCVSVSGDHSLGCCRTQSRAAYAQPDTGYHERYIRYIPFTGRKNQKEIGNDIQYIHRYSCQTRHMHIPAAIRWQQPLQLRDCPPLPHRYTT